MCPPTYLPALPAEHCWTADATDALDPGRALDEWHGLRALVDEHIAPVVEAVAQPWALAMTFTRDIGVLVDEQMIALEPHLRRGAFETPLASRAWEKLGVDVANSAPVPIDGGNVLADSHGRLLIGADRDDNRELRSAAKRIEELTGRPAYRVPITGKRFPHIDMAIADLQGRAWVVFPDALPGYRADDPAWRSLFLERPVIAVSDQDAELHACNLVVGDGVVVGPVMSDGLAQSIEAIGFAVLRTPLGEFAKAGGGAHCLTLELP